MLKLFVDSDSDVTLQEAKKYGATMISMPYEVKGELVYPYRDFEEFDDKAFYDMLRSGVLPTTSALNLNEYLEIFEPTFKEGNDILYVHFSRKMTATFNNMDAALKELKEKYPERKFYEIDAMGITISSYATTLYVMELYKAGLPAEEIVKKANDEVQHFATYFFADDLKFFRKSGRVSGLSAVMGNLIGIKPILTMNKDGVMQSLDKARGTKNALNLLVDYMDKLKLDMDKFPIIVGHSDSIELVNKLVDLIKNKFGDKLDIRVVKLNPTAGSHCGPNAVGVCFHAIHR